MKTRLISLFIVLFVASINSPLVAQLSLEPSAEFLELDEGSFLGKLNRFKVLYENDTEVYLLHSIVLGSKSATVLVFDKQTLALSHRIEDVFDEDDDNISIKAVGKLNDRFVLIKEEFIDYGHVKIFAHFPEIINNQFAAGEKLDLIEVNQTEMRNVGFGARLDESGQYLLIATLKENQESGFQESLTVFDADLKKVFGRKREFSDKYNLDYCHIHDEVVSLQKDLAEGVFDEEGNLFWLSGHYLYTYRLDQNYDRWIYRIPDFNLGAKYYLRNSTFKLDGDRIILSSEIAKDITSYDWDRRAYSYVKLESLEAYVNLIISKKDYDIIHQELNLLSDEIKQDRLNLSDSVSSNYHVSNMRDYIQHREIVSLNDGSFLRIAERFTFTSYGVGYGLRYGAIELTKFNADGKMEWTKSIDKMQGHPAADLLVNLMRFGPWDRFTGNLSFQYKMEGDNIYFFYVERLDPMDATAIVSSSNLEESQQVICKLNTTTGEIERNVHHVQLSGEYNMHPFADGKSRMNNDFLIISTPSYKKLRLTKYTIKE